MDNPYLYVDISEPDTIFNLLVRATPAIRVATNIKALADYTWVDCQGQLVSVERKQWAELLGDVDSVEAQLRRYMPNTAELHLLVEGVAEPTAYGIDTYVKSQNKPYYRNNWSFGREGRSQPGAFAKVMAWFWQLDKCGITVHQTASLDATAYALAAFYKNSQKLEHTTLNRYYKERIELRSHNPQVESLMGLVGAGLGEVKASALIKRFDTVIDVLTAGVEEIAELDGFGMMTAEKLLKSVGRVV